MRNIDKLMLGSIELFCLAAEQGSFSAAAHAAGVLPASVSRAIGRLEQRLGVRLFIRSTRRMRLSESGERYYQQCRQALEQLQEAERALSGAEQVARGTLRLSLATAFGHYRVLPLLPRFSALHPELRVSIHLANRNVDFTAENFDLAIRGRIQPDSGLIARKLEDAALVLVAAPSYLAQYGSPNTLDDLAQYDCLQFVLPSNGQMIDWEFLTPPDASGLREPVSITTRGALLVSDDPLGPVALARHGGGITQTYRFCVAEDLRTGRLQEVLPAYAGRTRPFSLLYPAGRLPLRTRLLIDFLIEHLQ